MVPRIEVTDGGKSRKMPGSDSAAQIDSILHG